MKTERVQELLTILQQRRWTDAEMEEIKAMTEDREHMFPIEGDFSHEGKSEGVKYYDKPRVPRLDESSPAIPPEVLARLTPEERAGPIKALGLTQAEAASLAGEDARMKTIEATLADYARRLKALEDRAGVGRSD